MDHRLLRIESQHKELTTRVNSTRLLRRQVHWAHSCRASTSLSSHAGWVQACSLTLYDGMLKLELCTLPTYQAHFPSLVSPHHLLPPPILAPSIPSLSHGANPQIIPTLHHHRPQCESLTKDPVTHRYTRKRQSRPRL